MVTELQKRKLASVFYRYDRTKDGFVTVDDLEQQGRKVAELQGVTPGAADYDKIVSAYRKIWDLYFKPADNDGDNRVTFDEYVKVSEGNMASALSSSDSTYKSSVESVFDSIDLNGSGKIDAKEFAVYIKATNGSDHDAKVAFLNIDDDDDGYITKDEFAKKNLEYFTTSDPSAGANWFYGSY